MRVILYLFLLTCLFSFGQSRERGLLETLKLHYADEPQKLKAAEFLIDNISIHISKNYKWVDSLGNTVSFSELDYPDIDSALDAFAVLKDSIKIHPKKYTLKDSEVLTPELLIKNIDLAFDSWRNNPWSQSYDFKTFCEYILPYRSLVEPLEDWREDYQFLVKNAAQSTEGKNSPVDVTTNTILALQDFSFVSKRPDPIPLLSPKQLLFRRAGACPDLANLALLACRSVGLATTFDFTPHWGASSNRHFWNTIINKDGAHIPFNGNAYNDRGGLPYAYDVNNKRLAKVFRRTYSIQKQSLAYQTGTENIPKSFLKDQNIIDVTSEYVETGSLKYQSDWKNEIAYLNVFNTGKWRVIDWTKHTRGKYQFKNLGTDLVYLPSVYEKGKMGFAPYPILFDRNKQEHLLKPDYKRTFDFVFNKEKSEEHPYVDFNSLDIQDGEVYFLLVWDHKWKKVSKGVATGKNVSFKKVPKQGVYLIVSKGSNGYERIFVIDEKTQKIKWY